MTQEKSGLQKKLEALVEKYDEVEQEYLEARAVFMEVEERYQEARSSIEKNRDLMKDMTVLLDNALGSEEDAPRATSSPTPEKSVESATEEVNTPEPEPEEEPPAASEPVVETEEEPEPTESSDAEESAPENIVEESPNPWGDVPDDDDDDQDIMDGLFEDNGDQDIDSIDGISF